MSITIDDVIACPAVPSLPTVAVRVLELTRDPEMSLEDLTDAVQQDPAITARVLRTINSSYYALSRPCSSISRALAYLGVTTVKSLVLGFSLVDATRNTEGLDLNRFWRRALVSGTSARRLAAAASWGDTEVAFIAALLQDIGMFAMNATFKAEYAALLETSADDHRMLSRLERESFGFDHAEVGARLAEHWSLPPELVAAIAGHEQAPDTKADLMHLACLAGQFATAIDAPEPEPIASDAFAAAAQWFHLQRGAVETAMAVVGEDVRELASLFNVDAGEPVDINRILADAEDSRLVQQIALEREREALRAANRELDRQTRTDALTAVGNRARFDSALEDLVAAFSKSGPAFGLLLIDADHFKRINDTLGHPAGDAVLVELASRIERAVRDTDLVCRYGGEEFAVLLPGADATATERAAERTRRAIGDTPFALPCPGGDGGDEPKALEVTASIGATAVEPGTPGVTSDVLVRAADQALYAAKEAGRNRVRIGRLRASRAAA